MAQTLVQLKAPTKLRGRLIGLFNMSNNGLRAFSGVTVGVVGGLIGVHWSLAISAIVLLAITVALLALFLSPRGKVKSWDNCGEKSLGLSRSPAALLLPRLTRQNEIPWPSALDSCREAVSVRLPLSPVAGGALWRF